MYQRILVPVDGSETSNKALVAALQLARENQGRVRVLHSLDDLAYLTGYEFSGDVIGMAHDYAAKVLADALQMARTANVPADSRLVEAPGVRLGDSVAAEAKSWEADLVVVGTHGRRGIGRVLLGSGAEQVIRQSPVPVLAIRGSDAPAAAQT